MKSICLVYYQFQSASPPFRVIFYPINSNLDHFQSKSIPTDQLSSELFPIRSIPIQINSHPINSNPNQLQPDQFQYGLFSI